MLAIWSLVPLLFLNPAWTPGSSQFTYYWSQLGEFWASLCLHVKMKVQVDSLRPHELSDSWNFPDQNTGVGSLLLLQGILPNQGSHPGLPHCRRILYQLSHKGSPWILEWVAYPFSRGSSWLRNQIRVSCIAGGFFTNWAIREALLSLYLHKINPSPSDDHHSFLFS